LIAITGIGVVSPLGVGREASLEALRKGLSGLGAPELFDAGVSPVGEVRGFRARDYIPAMKARRMSRFSQFALSTAIQAVEDAKLSFPEGPRFRYGVICGTGLASTGSTDAYYVGLLRNGPEDTNPIYFPETVQNVAASQIAIHFGLTGPTTTFSHNETAGELALAYAAGLLAAGAVDAVLVSAADELSESTLRGMDMLGILGREGMRPFSPRAGGFVLGEGAATLVLEREEDAVGRGATPYARVAGIGFSSAPVDQLHFDRSARSMVAAMSGALDRAALGDPDLVSASASSVPERDAAESAAIGELFSPAVPVVPLREYCGFFLADGLLRLALTVLLMREGVLPGGAAVQISSCLVNSFSNGGSAASVALRRLS
jgi:3-oxoacyl-[acyl-carrier-protein] synthase II